MRSPCSRAAVALLALLCGCYTVAGDGSPAITQAPAPAANPPEVEHTVGAFTFVLGGGTPKPSFFDGEQLGEELMEVWTRRGYIRGAQFVEGGAFSPTSTIRMTLNGSQTGDVSFWLELLNALTLTLVPYTVTHHYDLQLVLTDARTGRPYAASVKDTDETWVEGLLILALPFSQRGHHATMERMADQLYEQLAEQGAFERTPEDLPAPSALPSL